MIVLCSVFCFAQSEDHDTRQFPVLKGPYLGQNPPGLKPEVFAPGIVSTTEKYELNAVFSPRMDEFYYEISTTTPEEKKKDIYFYIIMVSQKINGVWTKPRVAPFSGTHLTVDLCFSPDGNRLYFCSNRPVPGDTSSTMHIWYVDRLESGWSEPQILGPPIFSLEGNSQPTISRTGSMYFRKGDDLYYSRYAEGKFAEPVNLGSAINSQYAESKPYISSDESYLLFVRYEMPVSLHGGRGIYISCKQEDGKWSPARITHIDGGLPKVTPDGRQFFFSRGGDIYWMDAKIIKDLRLKRGGYEN